MQGVEVKRVADEEGDGGGKRGWVGKCMCMCVCVDLPTLHLFVSLCGAVVSAGGGHVKSRTPASRMAPLPGFARSAPPPPSLLFHSVFLACS